jgi:prepilin-type N-terminal cleavage/methylation domain-containing protein
MNVTPILTKIRSRRSPAATLLQGFTLLEMLIVVAILSALAFGAVAMVDESDEHVRFDSNKTRLIKLREGVIGDPSAFLNRPPIIQGYVADMGRLPNNVTELINQGDQPSWSFDSTASLWAGWRGPYLQTFVENLGLKTYPDGWGNTGDTNNFGWRFDVDQLAGTILAQSYGADGKPGGGSYDLDYPNSGLLVNQFEALVEVANWRVLVYLHNPTSGASGGEEEGGEEEGEGGEEEAEEEDDGLITICHKPGTPAEKTMTIPLSALPAHVGHGDFIGTCDEVEEGGEESGGDPLPLNDTIVRLRLYYPQEGSYAWPSDWPEETADRDTASYLSLPISLPAGLVPDGEVIEIQFNFGGSSKLIPHGIRSLVMVEDETGNPFGYASQSAWSLPLLPKMQIPTFRMAWALE